MFEDGRKKNISGKISPLTGGPERSFRLFVHLPDVVMVNGKHGEAVVVLVEERLGLPRRELVVVVVFSNPILVVRVFRAFAVRGARRNECFASFSVFPRFEMARIAKQRTNTRENGRRRPCPKLCPPRRALSAKTDRHL